MGAADPVDGVVAYRRDAERVAVGLIDEARRSVSSSVGMNAPSGFNFPGHTEVRRRRK